MEMRKRGGETVEGEARSLTAIPGTKLTVTWLRVVAVWVVGRGHVLDCCRDRPNRFPDRWGMGRERDKGTKNGYRKSRS